MSNGQTHAARYCSDLVRGRDEDRWLSAQYASGDNARKLMVLYAFHCELRRIPASVSEPPLGEIRLQWWREALQEIREHKRPRAHPVVEEIAAAGLAAQEFATQTSAAIDAAARPLYAQGFSDIDDLVDWLRRAEGTIDAAGVRLLGGAAALGDAAAEAGAVFALAREGASLAANLKAEIARCGTALWAKAAAGLRAAPADIAPAILHLALTPGYLRKNGRPFPIVKRVRLFAAMATGRY